MRTPQDLPAKPPRARNRARWWILGAVVVLVILLASLKSLATIYTDSLWFSSVHLHSVWTTLLAVKLGLFFSFGAVFFVVLWVNLIVCDRLGGSAESFEPEDELVKRYQHAVRPHAGWVYAVIALVLALIAASGSIGEWQNWILFTHGKSFGVVDPQFHWDVGFFVFKLPFLNFVVNWALVSLVVILVVTTIFHYLNGGIRAQRVAPRVRPAVKAHISVLLALIALVKAAGYVLARFQLDTSTNGYTEGAGYTDVHARLPALSLLVLISLAAAVVLLWNIRRQGWTLPVLAVGVWAFVALVVGVIYPAVLQALKVNPAQSTLEKPYIQRNITATRAAYGINGVKQKDFQGSTSISSAQVADNTGTLDNIRLWDPDPQIALQTFQKLQGVRSYYQFQSLSVDRYNIGGQTTPVLVGVRQINSSNLPSSSWVNTHLQYTHGIGLALAEANQTTSSGNPVFGIGNVPPTSSNGLPRITQPDVYFGENDPGYVVANTNQEELNYQLANGTNDETHYTGTGGVQMSSFLTKAAFAIRLGDFNLLISNLVTPQSRIMFVRDIQTMAKKAAPFLNFDADPYAVVVDGHIDWVQDAYTTSSQYPYSQNISSIQTPDGSGLPGSYNYVRNSVKVVIDAYSGQISYYDMTTKSTPDPMLEAYESAFPGMFKAASTMPTTLKAHLRYPEDIFSAQAAVYGRYHLTNPTAFYNAADAWNLSPTAGAGSPTNSLAVTLTTNAQGEIVSGTLQRMAPLLQVLQEPGQSQTSFNISDAYVPASTGQGGNQSLTAFMMAGPPTPGHPGQLTAYVTPSGKSVIGPVQADSEIQANAAVSQQITYLDQHGSQVLLGNTLMIPLSQSMLYVRPLYVTSATNSLPQLKYVIAVFGSRVELETSLDVALSKALGTSVAGVSSNSTAPSTGGSGNLSPTIASQIQSDLKAAANDYAAAESALKAGDLGSYQNAVNAMNQDLQAAQQLINSSAGTAPTTTTTTAPSSTTTTKPKTSAPTKKVSTTTNGSEASASEPPRSPPTG